MSVVGCGVVDAGSASESIGVTQAALTQPNAPWHLDRLDQATLPLSTTYTYQYTGAGVSVYVLSTGIRVSHNEFAGRAVFGYGTSSGDPIGTGTQLAGVVGGSVKGVAKHVSLVSVMVHGEDPATDADLAAGLNWVRLNAIQPAVALVGMPITNAAASSLRTAVQALATSGVTVVLPIGESATIPTSFTGGGIFRVGATDASDSALWASAVGPVDIRAPGANITTAGFVSNSSVVTVSGTIYAAAIVAGLAATYLEQGGLIPPASVKAGILSLAVPIPSTPTDGAKLAQMAW